jgi:hypothetical protein
MESAKHAALSDSSDDRTQVIARRYLAAERSELSELSSLGHGHGNINLHSMPLPQCQFRQQPLHLLAACPIISAAYRGDNTNIHEVLKLFAASLHQRFILPHSRQNARQHKIKHLGQPPMQEAAPFISPKKAFTKHGICSSSKKGCVNHAFSS